MPFFRLMIVIALIQASAASAETLPPTGTLDYDVYVVGSVQKVWDALTVKDFVDQYFMCPQQRFELAEGGIIEYGNPGKILLRGKVLTVKEKSHLVYSLTMAGGVDTKVDITLEAVNPNVTHLKLEQTSVTWTDKDQADYRDGWPIILSGLKTLIETGKSIPWR
jgi:uncharacterized protein YndB with AHSA1/START domain